MPPAALKAKTAPAFAPRPSTANSFALASDLSMVHSFALSLDPSTAYLFVRATQ